MTLGDMNWGGLVALTLRNPRAAAAQLINWQLPRGVIWMALVLVSCMNAILAGLSELLFPSPVPLPSILMNPLMLFALLAGGLLVTVHVLHWAGRVVGGQGALEDIAIVLTWLQALRAVGQAAVVVLALVSPALAGMFAMAVMFVGLWIMANFIAQALSFASAWKAFGLMVVLMIGFIFGIMILLAVTGLGVWGLDANV
ncbi:YIP1 family protein [uncultured Pseudosulfitobacter sp.]|uniref:YIP1 family protein n=1 Tax=uncultured Pseudosulfitobacter sp. TaxID=2854214 RepID=UPI0030DA99A8|tara:strand:- start:7 stop:603 length:597 start_codon:yes stop_codon:yes gene_type:complete